MPRQKRRQKVRKDPEITRAWFKDADNMREMTERFPKTKGRVFLNGRDDFSLVEDDRMEILEVGNSGKTIRGFAVLHYKGRVTDASDITGMFWRFSIEDEDGNVLPDDVLDTRVRYAKTTFYTDEYLNEVMNNGIKQDDRLT